MSTCKSQETLAFVYLGSHAHTEQEVPPCVLYRTSRQGGLP